MKKLSELLISTSVVQFTTDSDPEIRALQYDSRRVESGDCFFAVRGTQVDGHRFIRMAEERGAFPIYDAAREASNPMIQRIKEVDPELYEQMVKHGRRNIAMLTIAPTGTVSICTQTTSGIEPVFMVSYKRRRKVNPNDKNAKVSFTDNDGNSFEEYNVFHPKFMTWLEVNGYNVEEVKDYDDAKLQEIINQSPYYKATANDIDWVNKVKMQGEMQKWVDHSISVTVNVPAETTEELVSQIYQTAWECGCKGMTIYRDGSRTGVLVSNKTKEEKKNAENDIIETHSPIRPKTLECDVVRFQNNYEKWIAFVGKINNKPYEIFLGKQDDFYLPPFVETAWITKNKGEEGRSR